MYKIGPKKNVPNAQKNVPNALFYTVPSTRVRREGEVRFLGAVPTLIFPNSVNNVTPGENLPHFRGNRFGGSGERFFVRPRCLAHICAAQLDHLVSRPIIPFTDLVPATAVPLFPRPPAPPHLKN